METVHRNSFRTSILIADDHAIFAEALRVYLLEKTFAVSGAVESVLTEPIPVRHLRRKHGRVAPTHAGDYCRWVAYRLPSPQRHHG
jgi:hypothetical protein